MAQRTTDQGERSCKLVTGDRFTRLGSPIMVGRAEADEIFYKGAYHPVVIVSGLDLGTCKTIVFAAPPDQEVTVTRGV